MWCSCELGPWLWLELSLHDVDERCRAQANNAKLSAQNTRAREAFYACKPYAEIYEEAFGKPLSFKNPERAKLCSRLDRWIERQFSKSVKGKSALKRGAARR